MFYKFKFHTIFRKFNDIGYLIYQRLPYDVDRVVNETGAIFLSYLSYEPLSIDVISKSVLTVFNDVSYEDIKKDMTTFFDDLVKEGFLDSGKNFKECLNKIDDFDYSISQIDALKSIPYDRSGIRMSTQEYLENYFAKNPQMLKCQIEITNKCNERCVHCYIPHASKVHDIEEKVFYDAIEELGKMGIVSLGISGGEPMLHPKFKQFFDAASRMNVNITLLTNLTLLDDEHIDMFKKSRVTIIPSLYSLNESNHDYITQIPGSCKKTIEGILKLIKHNIPVQINCPLMKSNKDDFIELVHWAKEHNIIVKTDYCIIARCDRSTDNLENRIELDDMQKITDEIIEENVLFKEVISADDYEEQCRNLFNDEDGKWCGVGITCCCIDAEGNVCPCPSWSDFNCGNLKNETLSSIWFNAEKLKYIRSLSKKDFVKCNTCEDKAFCTVCMAKNANESPTKDPTDVNDYSCKLTHINRISIENWRKKNGF